MLSNKHLWEEIKEAENVIAQDKIDDVTFKKVQLKLDTLQLKLLHNLRTNTVAVMKHFKIEMIKPKEDVQHEE